MDPFDNLNKLHIDERKRFEMAWELYKQHEKEFRQEGNLCLPDMISYAFKTVDEFIDKYLKEYAK